MRQYYEHIQQVEADHNGKRVVFKSKAEYRYAGYLEMLETAGEIRSWDYEPERLTFGEGSLKRYYTPDYVVINGEGRKEYHEYKGRMTPANSSRRFKMLREFMPDAYVVLIIGRIPTKGSQVGTYKNCKRFIDEVRVMDAKSRVKTVFKK